MLALRANRTVSADELIDGLWAERPPASAAKNVQFYVSQLRKALAADDCGASIVTHGGGYELQVPAGRGRRGALRAPGRGGAREPASAGANGAASAALELWRGAPLADVASEPFAPAEIRRLEELHLRALELAIDAELAAGRHDEVVARLEALIAEEPLRERLHAQRMLALYRAGRQSEALDAYRQAHRTLAEQIGVEPGPELQRLQEQILAQDPALDAPAPIVELPRRARGRLAAARRARARACLAAPALGSRRARGGWSARWSGGPPGSARRGSSPSSRPRSRAPGRRCSTPAAARSPTPPWRPLPRPGRATDRRCWCSTTPTTPRRRCSRPPRRSPASPRAGRSWSASCTTTSRARPPSPACSRQAPPSACGSIRWARRRPPRSPRSTPPPRASRCRCGRCSPRARGCRFGSTARPASGRGRRRPSASPRPPAVPPSDRSGLRAAEAAIAGGVVDLQSASERTRLYAVEEPPDPSEPEVCPFRGLAPFDAAHAEYFFGRERLVAELVARLVGSTLLAVVGPSGSGKSSAVRAGLLPALADGVVPGSERWRRAVMRPGERPLAELSRTLARAVPEAGGEDAAPWIADALERLGAGERLVLSIDQFEEAFVACRDQAERAAFFDALVEGAGRPRRAAGRRARDPRRLLRRAAPSTPSSRRWSAPTRSWSGRCAATSCAGRSSCRRAGRDCGSSRGWSRRWSATSPASPAACRCSRPRCSSSGSGATAARLRYAGLRAHRRRRGRGRAPGRGRLRAPERGRATPGAADAAAPRRRR